MARACEAAGAALLVNCSLTWSASTREAKALVDKGVIGRVLEARWRAGHTGPSGPSAAHVGGKEVIDGMPMA
jgi:predicted dehydrogenase